MKLPPIGILCGGLGTRLKGLTSHQPKSLISVAGEPFLGYQLRLLANQGFEQSVLMIGHRGNEIRDFAGDGSRFGLSVTYSDEGDARLGTGGALLNALPLLGSDFFVTYGDAFLEFDAVAMWQRYCSSGAAAVMAVMRNCGRWGRSNVVFDGDRVVRHDKTDLGPGMKWIDWGVTVFSATAITAYARMVPFDLADITKALASAGQLVGFVVTNRFYEIGSMEGLAETEAYLTLAKSAR